MPTRIPWTDEAWNPIRARWRDRRGYHCEPVSPGCRYCYAEGINRRVGTGLSYRPALLAREPSFAGVHLELDGPVLRRPLLWQRRRMIFVCSMTDLFGSFVELEWIGAVVDVIEATERHIYQVLTKRADRLLEFATSFARAGGAWPPPNAWIGVSIEDRRRWDERVPVLREVPAALRWLSLEPLLEPLGEIDLAGIGWVVAGGESGAQARPYDLEWARRLRDQCAEQGVPFFHKQLGTRLARAFEGRATKGEEMVYWPADLRVRERPAWPGAI